MIVFVPPEQVSVDPSLSNIAPEHLNLAKALFNHKPPPQQPKPQPTVPQQQPPQVSNNKPPDKSSPCSISLWSLRMINRWVLLTVVCVVGLVCIFHMHRPFLSGGRANPVMTSTVYVLLVLVSFALS